MLQLPSDRKSVVSVLNGPFLLLPLDSCSSNDHVGAVVRNRGDVLRPPRAVRNDVRRYADGLHQRGGLRHDPQVLKRVGESGNCC